MSHLLILIQNLGDESTSHLTILKLNNQLNESNTKALIFPGIEGVGGKIFFDFAKKIKRPAYLLQCMNICNINDINEMSAALIEVILMHMVHKTIYNNEFCLGCCKAVCK